MVKADNEANIPGVPNYDPAQMRRWALVVASVMSFLAAVAICLRLLCRRIRKQPLWWDDYLIMFSMLWNWVVVAIALAMYAEGVGYHASTIGPVHVANISRYLLVSEVIYIWHMCWTKISVLVMYYRIFHVPHFKKMVIAVGSFVVIWAFAGTFLFTFICVPTEKLWHPELPGHCISEMGVWLANASSTIFSDIAILILPIPQVWKLNTIKAEKIGLTFVFGLGFFTVFTSSYRVWVLFNYSKDDISYTLFPLLVWTDIEMCAAVISACLPTLRPFMQVAGRKLGLSRRSRNTESPDDPSFGRESASGKNTNNTMSSQNTALQRIESKAESRRSLGVNFYRLPEQTEMDEILLDVNEYSQTPQSKDGSKTSWYTPSTLEADTDRDDGQRGITPTGVTAMEPVYKINSFK